MSKGKRLEKAAEYFRRAPNYSGEAIAAFRKWENPRLPLTGRLVTRLAGQLEASHKFLLPYGGRFFDSTPSNDDIRSWRPPFPLTAFEFDAAAGRNEIKECELPVVVLLAEGEGWVWMYLITRQASGWSPCAFWAAFRREVSGDVGADLRDVIPYDMSSGAPDAAGRVRFGIFPEAAETMAERWGITSENVAEYAPKYLAPAMISAIQTCVVLSCSNVSTEILRPSAEARKARPATTLFDYHILTIQPGKERHESEPARGHHSSPRTHLRRGHIRKHPTAGRIWINSCLVNPSAIGTVNKDYWVALA